MTSGYGGTDSTPTVEFLSEEATMTEGADFIPDDNITLANSNSTAELPHDQVYLVAVPVLLVLSFCAILLNTTVLMSSRKIRRDNMNPFIRLTLSLTFANLLTSIVISASLLFDSLLPVGLKIKMPEFHYCFSLVIEIFRYGGLSTIALHFIILAILANYSIDNPLRTRRTRKYLAFHIFMMYFIPHAFYTIYFASQPNQGFLSPHCKNNDFFVKFKFRIMVLTFFITLLTLMAFLYGRISRKLIRGNSDELHQNMERSAQRKRIRRNVKTTFLYIGTYLLGWMPCLLQFIFICDDCLYNFSDLSRPFKLAIVITTNFLLISKALMDPIVYAMRDSHIKIALRRYISFNRTPTQRTNSTRFASQSGRGSHAEDTMPLRFVPVTAANPAVRQSSAKPQAV